MSSKFLSIVPEVKECMGSRPPFLIRKESPVVLSSEEILTFNLLSIHLNKWVDITISLFYWFVYTFTCRLKFSVIYSHPL